MSEATQPITMNAAPISWLSRLLGRLRGWLWSRVPTATEPAVETVVVEPSPIVPNPPSVVTVRPKRTRKKRERIELHVTDVLNLLPKCRELIAPMKRAAPDLYKLWHVMGAKLDVKGRADSQAVGPLPEKFPTTGMVFFYFEDADARDIFPGLFVGWSTVENDPYWAVVLPGAELFEVYVLYTSKKGRPFVYEYLVARHEGRIWVPSQRQISPVKLPKGGQFFREEWSVPSALSWHYKTIKKEHGSPHANPSAFGVDTLSAAVICFTEGKDDFQVRAERDGVSVAFNVALGRTPQFFKDRDTSTASDGRRKRIFHAVKEHGRARQDGTTTTVSAHYRGERSFSWHGESITITPASRSFHTTFNVRAILSKGQRPGMTTVGAIAEKLREASESEWRKRA